MTASNEKPLYAAVIPLFSGAERAANLFTRAMMLDESPATLADAERLYREVVRLVPAHWEAWNNLGAVLYNVGKKKAALEAWGKALEVNDFCEPTLNNLGVFYRDEDEFEKAAVYFVRALRIDDRPEARVNLALCLQTLGRFASARRHWLKYLDVYPRGEWSEMARKNVRVCTGALTVDG